MQNFGGIEGHEFPGLFFRYVAVHDGFSGFLIEAAGHFGIVTVEGRQHTRPVEESTVVGHRVDDFVLVGPPVGEGAARCAVLLHFIGHFVTLEDVGEGIDGKAKIFGHLHEHVDLTLLVAVAGNESLIVEYFEKSFHLHVLTVGPAALFTGFVLAGAGKVIDKDLLDTHPGLWVPLGLIVAPVALLHIFAQCEFDKFWSILIQHFLRRVAPAQFDDRAAPSDGVGRSVQQLTDGHTPRQLAVDVDVLAVHHVRHADLSATGLRALVHPATNGNVRVFVDHATGEVLAGSVDLQRAVHF